MDDELERVQRAIATVRSELRFMETVDRPREPLLGVLTYLKARRREIDRLRQQVAKLEGFGEQYAEANMKLTRRADRLAAALRELVQAIREEGMDGNRRRILKATNRAETALAQEGNE